MAQFYSASPRETCFAVLLVQVGCLPRVGETIYFPHVHTAYKALVIFGVKGTYKREDCAARTQELAVLPPHRSDVWLALNEVLQYFHVTSCWFWMADHCSEG